MKKFLILLVAAYPILYLASCTPKSSTDASSIASDSVSIAQGHALFVQNCSSCHSVKQESIGPPLGGLTASVSADWIRNFIKNPKAIIDSGDERAQKLIVKYNSVMPSFAQLTPEDVNGIIAFLHTQKAPDNLGSDSNLKGLANPIPEPIGLSDLVVDLKFLAQIPPSRDKLPLTRITKLDFQPNTDKLFVLDLRGKLYSLQKGQPVVYMDMAKLQPRFIHEPGLATGFGSFAFHPDFAKNGLLYTTHCEPPGSAKADFAYADSIKSTVQWVITEWKTKEPGAPAFSGEGRELFRVNMVTGIHGVQEIGFNPHAKPGSEEYGLLYVGVGDGGSVEDGFPFLAHNPANVWGTILRIDPAGRNSANGRYGIPPNNPFVKAGAAGKAGEVYAYGFRNPHRITWSKSGQMLASNVGQSHIESLNLILPGHDYGWPIREGTFEMNPSENMGKVYPLSPDDSIHHITYPVAQFDHDEGAAITGGYEYEGKSIPALAGKFFFGDIPSGKLFYVVMKDVKVGSQATIKKWQVTLNGVPKTMVELCGTDRVDLHFGKDRQGELYLMTKPDGKVYKLVSATTERISIK